MGMPVTDKFWKKIYLEKNKKNKKTKEPKKHSGKKGKKNDILHCQ